MKDNNSTVKIDYTSNLDGVDNILARNIDNALPISIDVRKDCKPNFEQINDDLFAKDDNKYIVFNKKGAYCWNGNKAITKFSSIREDFQ